MYSHSKNSSRWFVLLWAVSILLLSIGCKSSPSLPETPAVVTATETGETIVHESGYPAPAVSPSLPASGYPDSVAALEVASGYPIPTQVDDRSEPHFIITAPVNASDTIVTGQALPGLSLAIVDISYNGIVLGTGPSDENGRFSIPVSSLIAGNRIGVTLFELQPGQKTIEDAAVALFPHRGEGYMNLPNVGIFFDTLLVSP